MFGQGEQKSVSIGQFVRVRVHRKLSVATLKKRLERTPDTTDANESQQGNWTVWFPRYGRKLVLLYAPPCNLLFSSWGPMSLLWKQVQERRTES